MFKLSKEARITFLGLLVVPLVWIVLNSTGVLDGWKTASVDARMTWDWKPLVNLGLLRGEVDHRDVAWADDEVRVEDNKTVPRVPKVMYVNMDYKTLKYEWEDWKTGEEDYMGERPWDRAFFGEVARILIERGNARVVAFDFYFSSKSASKLVPFESIHQSDSALGNTVAKHSDRIVLGASFSGTETSVMKKAGFSAMPPFFHSGYINSGNDYRYPEAPTYPIQSYSYSQDAEQYLGRLGTVDVPASKVDPVRRRVPVWFPGGGSAQAYNVLGGKREKLNLDLIQAHDSEIKQLQADLTDVRLKMGRNEAEFKAKPDDYSISLQHRKESLTKKLGDLNLELKEVHKGERQSLNRQSVEDVEPAAPDSAEVAKLKSSISELDEVIGNLKKSLSDNPALGAVLGPRLKDNEDKRAGLAAKLEALEGDAGEAIVDHQRASELLKEIGRTERMLGELEAEAKEYEAFLELRSSQRSKSVKLALLQANEKTTQLLEKDGYLHLVYNGTQFGDRNGSLVDSLPNKMPLELNRHFYTLGVEALLSYYGLDDDNVRISEERDRFQIIGRHEDVLVDAPLQNGQFVEINWFSKWTEPVPEKDDLLEARKLFGKKQLNEYVELAPKILRAFLSRVNDLEVPEDDIDLPSALTRLKREVSAKRLAVAQGLIDAASGKIGVDEAPAYEELQDLCNWINLSFLPPSLNNTYNPMCSMQEIHFLDQQLSQQEGTKEEADKMIQRIKANLNKVLEINKEIPENGEFIQTEGGNYICIVLRETDSELEIKFKSVVKKLPKTQIKKRYTKKEFGEVCRVASNDAATAIRENKENYADAEDKIKTLNAPGLFGQFEDAIVFVGPEDKSLQDEAPTPFDASPVPKVSAHGNLVKTLTSGFYIQRMPLWVDHAATLLFSVLMAFLAVYSGAHSHLVQGCSLVFQLIYVLVAFCLFTQLQLVWPLTAPMCAGLSTSFVGVGVTLVLEQKAKGRLKGMFGSYVSSDLVEQMVESGEEPSLGGEETKITAYFSDVQAFSSFSELLSPTGLVDLMNEYLTAMTNILQEERGTLDKYIGDAIVAMYGAPIPMDDHAYQAVRTALLMQQRQIELREKWASEGDKWPDIVSMMQTRIGCNTGTATVGNMGALDRFNYTMMGDMVNLAARCESGAKAYGAYIMITEETMEAAMETKDDIAYRFLDKSVVKGRTQPVGMYEPTGFKKDLTQETEDCLDCFQQGMDKYLSQDWNGALKMFKKAQDLEPNKPGVTPGVQDNPSMILIDRCKVMKDNPPGKDWDGVFVMTSK